jgi:hypothetical protein
MFISLILYIVYKSSVIEVKMVLFILKVPRIYVTGLDINRASLKELPCLRRLNIFQTEVRKIRSGQYQMHLSLTVRSRFSNSFMGEVRWIVYEGGRAEMDL